MTINKCFRYELEPNKEQSMLLKQHAGNARFIWNNFVDLYNLYKEEKYTCTKSDFQKLIHDLVEEFQFLKLSHSQALQFPAHNIVKTIKRAFDDDTVKERKKAIAKAMAETDEKLKQRKLDKAYNLGFPKYKKKSISNDSIYMPQGFKLRKSRIYVPKIGWIHYHKHRKFEGIVKTAIIVQDGEKWYISLCSEIDIKRTNLNINNIEGIDLGLTKFQTATDGTSVANPRHLKNKQKHLRKVNKKLSRKYQQHKSGEEFSNNFKKQSKIVRTVHRKIKNTRKDFLMKTANHMIAKYDGIVVEDLYVKGMLKNKKLAKHISDVSWSEYLRILEYMCLWNSKYFIQIGRWEATSKTCSNCGWKNNNLKLSDRTFDCPLCGLQMDRDQNASINIKAFGIKLIDEFIEYIPEMIEYLSFVEKTKEYKQVEEFVKLGNLGILKYKDFMKVKSIVSASLKQTTTAGTAGCNACGDVSSKF